MCAPKPVSKSPVAGDGKAAAGFGVEAGGQGSAPIRSLATSRKAGGKLLGVRHTARGKVRRAVCCEERGRGRGDGTRGGAALPLLCISVGAVWGLGRASMPVGATAQA